MACKFFICNLKFPRLYDDTHSNDLQSQALAVSCRDKKTRHMYNKRKKTEFERKKNKERCLGLYSYL